MAAPEDPQVTYETALLARAFRAHAALAPAQVAYLRERGFIPCAPEDDYREDYHEEERYQAQLEAEALDNELDAAGDRVAARRPAGRGRSERSAPEWSLTDPGRRFCRTPVVDRRSRIED